MTAPAAASNPTPWHLYLVRCADGSLYTGVALDVTRRLEEHRAGSPRGARYLRGRGPLELVLSIAVGTRAQAQRLEHAVKALPKRDKEALVVDARSLAQLAAEVLVDERGGPGPLGA